jgi:hypothetical protein
VSLFGRNRETVIRVPTTEQHIHDISDHLLLPGNLWSGPI